MTLPATTRDVGEILSSTLAKEKADNRQCLLKVLSSLRFLVRQDSAIRGHDEKDGNLYQLLKLRCEDDHKVRLGYIQFFFLLFNISIIIV